jgi:hypothetical protein
LRADDGAVYRVSVAFARQLEIDPKKSKQIRIVCAKTSGRAFTVLFRLIF